MRIYVPATFSMLETLRTDQELALRRGIAFAVTGQLREFFSQTDDEEELAYQAYIDAARASLRLLSAGGETRFPHRRVVLTFEVDPARVDMDAIDDDSAVQVSPPVLSVDDLASIHIDIAGAEADTAEAIRVIDEADLGEDDAEHLLANCEDNELAWYDPVELPFLLEFM